MPTEAPCPRCGVPVATTRRWDAELRRAVPVLVEHWVAHDGHDAQWCTGSGLESHMK